MKTILTALIAIIFLGVQTRTQAQTQPQTQSQAPTFPQAPTTDTTKAAPKIQTVFSNPGKLGWWVAPDWAWTKFNDRDVFLMGLSAGIIVKHSFSIGLAGYGILNSNNLRYSNINDTADVYLYGGYGGLKLEYRLYPLNMINLSFPLLIGGGGLTYSTWGYDNTGYHQPYEQYYYIWDSFFVIEPGVMVGVNLLKFMRFDAGTSYRFTSSIDLPRTDKDLMNGFNVNMSLKFGRF